MAIVGLLLSVRTNASIYLYTDKSTLFCHVMISGRVQGVDQPAGKVANPARGQLNREKRKRVLLWPR